MVLYGLIGYPLNHSLSAVLFSEKFRANKLYDRNYRLFPLTSPEQIKELVNGHPGIAGLNVTAPFKEKIIPFLDKINPLAAKIGAVNTIRVSRTASGTLLTGYNTDSEGFSSSTDFAGIKTALILGTGGAAKAVAQALRSMEIKVLFVSRNSGLPDSITYARIDAAFLKEFTLIVNATPLGMYPEVNSFPPIPYKHLAPDHFLYDLVYNPDQTRFLKKGIEKGCRMQNGLQMLKNQADLSLRIWEGF